MTLFLTTYDAHHTLKIRENAVEEKVKKEELDLIVKTNQTKLEFSFLIVWTLLFTTANRSPGQVQTGQKDCKWVLI